MNKPFRPELTATTIRLPKADRSLETFRLSAPRDFPARLEGKLDRIAFSAAHVVADPLAECDPWLDTAVDWDATIDYRRHLWRLGLGVAEAMDTAQRGMGLDWKTSLELIGRSVAAAGKGARTRSSFSGRRHRSSRRPRRRRAIDDVIQRL